MWLKHTSLGSSASMQTAQEAWHKLKIARILASRTNLIYTEVC